jgi:transcriptional regulator with XRE-family HTH domain
MEGDQTWDEYMAEKLRDPEYAKAHAIGRPFSNLSLNVWAYRTTAGMTQEQLAEAAEMSQPRIATIERDEANPTLMTISRIAVALGVTADRLLAEPEEWRLAQARAASETGTAPELSTRPARRRKTA